MLIVGAAVVLVRQCGRDPVPVDPPPPVDGVPIVTAPADEAVADADLPRQ